MSNRDRDNLENFFRNRTQQHNIEFQEEDWKKLERRLDQEMPVPNSFASFLKKFWFIPLLLLLIPLAWISYNQYSMTTKNIGLAKTTKQESTIDKNYQPAIQNTENIELKGTKPDSDQQNNIDPSGSYKYQKIQNVSAPLAKEAYENQDNTKKLSKSNDIGYAVYEDGANFYGNSAIGLHFLSAIPPKSLVGNTNFAIISNYQDSYDVLPQKTKKASFNIGIGYSPDFSTVGIGNFVSPGSRWTIVAEYGISNRFLLNTGVVLVNNKYEAYGEDYHAPSRYWRKGIVADEAYGECKMIDIPLNLRYNFFVKGRNQLFASAGASTYFVLKEDYYFHYDIEDPELPDHWGTDKMTIYPFGIINFSVGFQHKINMKSSFQIEPFVKIPTTGIGWGNVDLHTMGIYFMYKYQIGK